MIFGCDSELEIGKPFTPASFSDETGAMHAPQPFFIVRESTAEGYLRELVADGANPVRAQIAAREWLYFYEVETD